jgi:ankyrin repeat protein
MSNNYNSKQIFVLPAVSSMGHAIHGGSPTTFFTLQQMFGKNEKLEQELELATRSQQQKEDTPIDNRSLLTLSQNLPSSSGLTYYPALHSAAALGQVLTVIGLLENNSELVDINQQDHNGNTALMWAASEGYSETVQLLMENNADANVQNFAGETALILAAARGHLRVCSILLENGAQSSLPNMEQASPLHFAAANGHIEVIRLLVRYGAYVNAQDEEGDTALHYAIREKQFAAVRCLVSECGAWVDLKNEDSETPLNLASCLEESEMVRFLAPLASAETEHGGDLMVF